MICPKCEKLLKLKEKSLFCTCGYTTKNGRKKEKIETSTKVVISDGKNIFAVFPHKCKKCNHEKAEIIELGVWYNDEDMDIMYKCGKCGFCERDDDMKVT